MKELNIISEIEKFSYEYQGEIKAKNEAVIKEIEKFSSECGVAMTNECEEMFNSLQGSKPIKAPRLNYLEIIKVQSKEEIYTQFLEWLLNPESEHNLKTKPLRYFLEKLVDTKYKFSLEGIKIKAEKALPKKGTPDLTIEGNNFICFVEVKIKAGEGEKQLKRYQADGTKVAGKKSKKAFFIYLTLTPKETGETKFKNIIWDNMIRNILVPCYKETTKPIKRILQLIIYNLQKNKDDELVEFFDNLEKYKQDRMRYYLKLKKLKEKEELCQS